MKAVIIIAVIVVPVVAYYIGKEFEYIANEKGYTSKKYFWWTFLFGAVGPRCPWPTASMRTGD